MNIKKELIITVIATVIAVIPFLFLGANSHAETCEDLIRDFVASKATSTSKKDPKKTEIYKEAQARYQNYQFLKSDLKNAVSENKKEQLNTISSLSNIKVSESIKLSDLSELFESSADLSDDALKIMMEQTKKHSKNQDQIQLHLDNTDLGLQAIGRIDAFVSEGLSEQNLIGNLAYTVFYVTENFEPGKHSEKARACLENYIYETDHYVELKNKKDKKQITDTAYYAQLKKIVRDAYENGQYHHSSNDMALLKLISNRSQRLAGIANDRQVVQKWIEEYHAPNASETPQSAASSATAATN